MNATTPPSALSPVVDTQMSAPSGLPLLATHVAHFQGSDRDAEEPRWVRDLLVLQVTSIFAAGLFMAVWLTH